MKFTTQPFELSTAVINNNKIFYTNISSREQFHIIGKVVFISHGIYFFCAFVTSFNSFFSDGAFIRFDTDILGYYSKIYVFQLSLKIDSFNIIILHHQTVPLVTQIQCQHVMPQFCLWGVLYQSNETIRQKVSTKLLVLGVPGYQLTKLKPNNLYHPTEPLMDGIY